MLHMLMIHHIANRTELIGTSDKGWEEAAQVALDEATKTIRKITESYSELEIVNLSLD